MRTEIIEHSQNKIIVSYNKEEIVFKAMCEPYGSYRNYLIEYLAAYKGCDINLNSYAKGQYFVISCFEKEKGLDIFKEYVHLNLAVEYVLDSITAKTS